MPAAHVFVTRGDLLHFYCDAWMLPTDAARKVTKLWRGARGVIDGEIHVAREGDFGAEGCLAAPVLNSGTPVAVTAAVPWGGVEEEGFLEHIGRAVEQFARVAAEAVHSRDRTATARILLAMPSFSTGSGGTVSERGQVLRILLESAQTGARAAANHVGRPVDIAIVLNSSTSYALAQRIRSVSDETWAELDADQRSTAKVLAKHARAGRLVPFMGAGVSMSAGAPSWRNLLERLAVGIGLDAAEKKALFESSRSALDQATILRSRYLARDLDFLQAVADEVTLDRYGLAPALLATLGTAEAITLNYDTLFEDASHDVGIPRRILPEGGDDDATSWLLKLHGTVTNSSTIVLTRDDYLGFAATRSALSAIVKATLMTRHLLFVGFGLRDDHFHEIVHDVRRAVPGGAGARATAMTLRRDPLDAELWSGSLDLVAMAEPEEVVEVAARRLEIMLDMVVALASDSHEYLLDESFATARSDAEQLLVDRLKRLNDANDEERQLPAWQHVQRLLNELGGGKRSLADGSASRGS